ncbi:hypothetical protein DMH25_29020 [Streptomyces sp. WAC 01325]|uniref:hypothetical protein n=1 Tax=Streptomyces sp. WAC 01325 TaxID=2203202 RepID=UPI000F894134|nr:hypothetical protein [Streptomyces sp. WAC 01325]RSM98909.1 hypothetical protein DMH25_29020 [Streptomyces sp. WAC 01325]
MRTFTATAHIQPDTESVIHVFDGPDHTSRAPFLSLRVGNGDVDVVFIADLGTADALRALAAAADKAATILDELAARAPGGAA